MLFHSVMDQVAEVLEDFPQAMLEASPANAAQQSSRYILTESQSKPVSSMSYAWHTPASGVLRKLL